jgi:protein-S-isoprenylcysteine O-methyltransferase Ste14
MSLAIFAFVMLFDAIALLLLYQWGSPDPWARVDLFSGGYLVLSTLLALTQFAAVRRIAPSRADLHTFTSQHIDPSSKYWMMGLAMAEFAVFYDYGQLRLTPWLERGFLQGMGLGAYLVALIWMAVTGSYLKQNYPRSREEGHLLMSGPYAAMRHPLYSALLVSRVAFALIMASPIAWALTALWIWRITLRIRREEVFLRHTFGELYDAYSRRTPALIHASIASLFRRYQSTTDPSSSS